MKRVLICWLVSMACITVVPAAADDLVTFQRTEIAEARSRCGARVVAKLDNVALALVPSGNLHALKAIAAAELIEAGCDLEKYWVMPDIGGRETRPIFRTEHYQVLRLTTDEARALMASGARLIKCMDLNLPPDKLVHSYGDIQIGPGILTDLDSLIALVSVDSVRSYIQRLQDFQTRYTGTDSFISSGNWIFGKFASWGYSNIEFQNFWVGGYSSRNVIATKLGTVHPDKVIVIGGHYDSVVYDGGDPNSFAPGADDNATGAAFTLEIARVLAQTPLKQTVRFVAFGAEEQGLIGSQVYVYYALLNGENIQLMINADMIGNVADSYLNFNVNCNETGEVFGTVLAALAAQHTTLIPVINVGEYTGSDHFPFDQAGFRTVYSAEGDFSPNWHEQTDVIANIDVAYCADIVRSNLGLLVTATAAPPPISDLGVVNAGDGHTAYMSWGAFPDSEVVGYEVRYGLAEDQLNFIDTTLSSADTIRNLADGTRYYWGVAAIAPDGTRGLPGNIVGITVRSIPTVPDTLIVSPFPGEIQLTWPPSPDPDFDHFQIWRRVGDSGNFEPRAQITGEPIFIDQNLQSNTRYYYYLTSIDTTDLESQQSMTDYAKKISFDSGVLLVDETADGGGGQGQPTDAQQDSFHAYISQGCRVSFHDYAHQGAIRINDLGPYSTVAWIDDDPNVHNLPDIDTHLARYLSFGGKLLIIGWRTFYGYDNGRPYVFQPGSFPHDDLKIDTIRSSNIRDFIRARAVATGWPDLNVIPERILPAFNGRLPGVDVMTFNDSVLVLYTFDSASDDTLYEGRPVGFVTADGSCIHSTFPLYAMGNESARQYFATVMAYFGEPVSVSDDERAPIPEKFMAQSFPNPFNAATTIRFNIAKPGHVRLSVYNVLGQEVAMLVDMPLESGSHSRVWDAREAPSGIYFYRLRTAGGDAAGRTVLLK